MEVNNKKIQIIVGVAWYKFVFNNIRFFCIVDSNKLNLFLTFNFHICLFWTIPKLKISKKKNKPIFNYLLNSEKKTNWRKKNCFEFYFFFYFFSATKFTFQFFLCSIWWLLFFFQEAIFEKRERELIED